jgi:hypothetical protein
VRDAKACETCWEPTRPWGWAHSGLGFREKGGGDLSLLREVCLVLTDAVNCKLFWCNTKHDQAFVLCALGARA